MLSGKASFIAGMAGALLLYASDQPQPPPRSLEELTAAVARVLSETKTPGAGLAIVSRDRILLTDGLGKADLATGRPATADTLFRIGSVSKAFASLSILQLQEQGRLRLSDPVRQYAPEIAFQNAWESTDPIRIVHLLEHTTGWDDLHFAEYASNDPKPLTLYEGLAFHPDSRTSRWRPGTRMAYCNSGPAVAAYIVGKISGQRFEDYVQQHLFHPMHMDTASYLYTPAVRAHLTSLYQADGVHPAIYRHITFRPSGAINASPRDMANYVRFYLNRGAVDGAAVVRPGAIARMEYPETTLAAHDGLRMGYGLSNYTTVDDRGFVWHGHDGGIDGGLTEMAYLPEADTGYAFMINATNGAAFGRIHSLLTKFLTRDLAPPPAPAAAQVQTALVEQYTGWGEPANPRGQLTYFMRRINGLARITLRGGKLGITPWRGSRHSYVPLTDRLWRPEKTAAPSLILISDLRDGRFVEADGEMYKLIPWWEAYGEMGGTLLVAALLASSVLYALYWIPAVALGLLRPPPGHRLHISLRMAPLIAVLTLAAAIGVFRVAGSDAIERLGHVTGWSVAILLLTILFAVATAAAAVEVWRGRNWPVKGGVRIHAMLVTAACVTTAIYLAAWGMIGLRTWN